MNTLVNTDGAQGPLSPATTITVIDPEATEVTSFTAFVSDANDNDIDSIGQQIADAVNANIETPIDFTAVYSNNNITLTASEAGNTNPWTIIFNNNGATTENAGNLSTTSSQTGQIINQIDVLTVTDSLRPSIIDGRGQTYIDLSETNDIEVYAGGRRVIRVDGNQSIKRFDIDSDFFDVTAPTITIGNAFLASDSTILFNYSLLDFDFNIHKSGVTTPAYNYNAGTDTTTIDSDTINFVANTITGLPTIAGADGLSITDTVNLNLLQGTTVLSTVMLPSAGGTTVVQGTTDEIDVTTVGDTNTLSLATAITGAITANTAKTGITTAQATAITDNTAKNSYPAADATKLATIETNADVTDTTNVVASLEAGNNITINPITGSISAIGDAVLANNQTFTGINTFNNNTAAGGISVRRITSSSTSAVSIDLTSNQMVFDVPIFSAPGVSAFLLGNTLNISTGIATFNPLNGDRDFEINKQTTGKAFVVDAGSDTMTIGSDVLTINSTTINGLPSKADALSISGQVLSLLDGTTVLDTVTLPTGGSSTTVEGTTNQIDVSTVGNTVTVSLDPAITSAINTNTGKTGITTAQASAITDNTAKTGITSTQAANIVTNNAKTGITTAQTTAIAINSGKITYPTAASTKLATIETGANVTDKANVDDAIGLGLATTDYYASDKTWKTIPTSGVGDAVLANNQTFTGINTFNNNTAAGGISVRRITSSATSAVSIDLSSNQIVFDVPIFSAPGTSAFLLGNTLNISTGIATFNPLSGDRDFEINKQTTGKALTYNAGTDTLTLGADNIVGVSQRSQSGTWTPVMGLM